MRTYPHSSPQAAARIVALAMLADGDVSEAELDALDRLGAHQQLGLQAADWNAVVYGLCDDLLTEARLTSADTCGVDPRTLSELMAEIENPTLRLKVLRLCVAVAEADGQVAQAESIMLGAAVEQWGLQREMLQPKCAGQDVEPA